MEHHHVRQERFVSTQNPGPYRVFETLDSDGTVFVVEKQLSLKEQLLKVELRSRPGPRRGASTVGRTRIGNRNASNRLLR